jgi:hypothetical protein
MRGFRGLNPTPCSCRRARTSVETPGRLDTRCAVYFSTWKSTSDVFPENAQHASQRFRSTPEQLIANSKGSKKFRPELQLVETADRYVQCPRNGRRSQAAQSIPCRLVPISPKGCYSRVSVQCHGVGCPW